MMERPQIEMAAPSPVLVIGGGLAGMYAAIAAWEAGQETTILSKGRTGGSGNGVVAMSVHRFAPDAPGLREEYRQRFLRSGAGEQEKETAEFFVDRAAGAMERLKRYGFPLEYRCLEEEGKDYPYLACCRPKQGRILTGAIRKYIDKDTGVAIQDGVTVCDIVTENGQVRGVLGENSGKLCFYPARAVILAAGGAGNIYAATSNTSDMTGDGYALALRCGLPLRGMEFVQFYPYRIYSPRRADIFPDLFEHGAVFRNEKGERFMDCPQYPMKELENRDVVARAMYGQREVRLDLSHCDPEYLERECPNISRMYREDPSRPLLLRPVAHFFMGGVPLKTDCSTAVKGLYVCGEVTGGLHGANRLAGSALTETVLFGRIAGEKAAGWARGLPGAALPGEETLRRVLADYPQSGTDSLRDLKDSLRETMWRDVSLVRTGEGLARALEELRVLEEMFRTRRPAGLKDWIQMRDMLMTARAVTEAAAARKESLGAHFRLDGEN